MASAQGEASAELQDRVEAAVGKRAIDWERPDTGLSPAHRFVVTFADGSRLFAKAATTEKTAAQLRNERLALAHAEGLGPAVVAWLDDLESPLLLTEALDGHWPASHRGVDWRPGDLDAVFAAMDRLRRLAAPPGLAPVFEIEPIDWPSIVADVPGSRLERIASPAWFERNTPALVAAAAALDRTGNAFVHGDMRSDNLCLMPDGPRFVDWSSAHIGSPDADLARFLPAAHLEGGLPPFDVFPDGGAWAAFQAGDTLRFAMDESAPDWLRRVGRHLAAINLDWAVASLGLEPRDGSGRDS